MAHSYVMLVLHIVFSTKGRVPFIGAEHRDRLYDYMGGIIRNERGLLLEVEACRTTSICWPDSARACPCRRCSGDQGEVVALDEWTARPRVSLRLAAGATRPFRSASRRSPRFAQQLPDAGTAPRTPLLPLRSSLCSSASIESNSTRKTSTTEKKPVSRPAGTRRRGAQGFQPWEGDDHEPCYCATTAKL